MGPVPIFFSPSGRGTPHWEFHAELDTFWAQYRPNGALWGRRPTCAQYDTALRAALAKAGYTESEVTILAVAAQEQRVKYGLTSSDPVPRIPEADAAR